MKKIFLSSFLVGIMVLLMGINPVGVNADSGDDYEWDDDEIEGFSMQMSVAIGDAGGAAEVIYHPDGSRPLGLDKSLALYQYDLGPFTIDIGFNVMVEAQGTGEIIELQ